MAGQVEQRDICIISIFISSPRCLVQFVDLKQLSFPLSTLQFYCNAVKIKKTNLNEKSLDKNNPESYKWKLPVKCGVRG